MSLRIAIAALALWAVVQVAAADGIEAVDGASFRTELSAHRGLVLVDLYADW